MFSRAEAGTFTSETQLPHSWAFSRNLLQLLFQLYYPPLGLSGPDIILLLEGNLCLMCQALYMHFNYILIMNAWETTTITSLYFFFLFFFWLCPWHVELPGPGIKPSHCNDNARSLTCWTTQELWLPFSKERYWNLDRATYPRVWKLVVQIHLCPLLKFWSPSS